MNPESYRQALSKFEHFLSLPTLQEHLQSLQFQRKIARNSIATMPRQFFVGGNFKMSVLLGGAQQAAQGRC
jgi:hypothetical protein